MAEETVGRTAAGGGRRARHRSTETGKVVSRAGNKTVVVEVSRRVQHPLYARYVNRRKKFHAHDEKNECRVGDYVRIAQWRRLSKLKSWRVQQIIARAAAPVPHVAGESAAS